MKLIKCICLIFPVTKNPSQDVSIVHKNENNKNAPKPLLYMYYLTVLFVYISVVNFQ